ncbi:GntT/GntP/DsdX family permease [Aeromonas salmonicida]|uniref:GntT/GntP/DsdX family permease n=1 Tax=Aeromonas salmonicida TaxID=645 RepID=UPI0035A37D72
MNSEVWVVGTLLTSIILIVFTIVKGKVHPFLALLLASFYVGTMMGMNPVKMVNAMEEGIGGTLGFLAAVIGLGTILGKMMEVSGAAERIGLALQKCRWLSPQVIMVLVGLAVGRASGFVGRAMERLLDGFYTLSDQEMYDLLGLLARDEQIKLEPSALAGMPGPWRIAADREWPADRGFDTATLARATHLVWATGGGMVPAEEMEKYLTTAKI